MDEIDYIGGDVGGDLIYIQASRLRTHIDNGTRTTHDDSLII